MNETDSSPAPERAFKNRLSFRLLVLLAGMVLMVWWAGGFHREPLHKGKPISYWVDRACTGYDEDEVWEFRNEVKNIGPTAVPKLVSKLRTSDRWRSVWLGLRARLPARVQQRFSDTRSAQEIRYGAVRTLAIFGADAKSAVPELVRLLPGMDHAVIVALAAIGPGAREALPGLRVFLPKTNTPLRLEVARASWLIGRETNIVLEICTNAMIPLTTSWEPMAACALLVRLGTAAAPAVPFALRVLQNTNYPVRTRANAACALGAAKITTAEIQSALLDGTTGEQDQFLRSNCALALWRFDSQYAALATRLVLQNILELKKRSPQDEDNFVMWLEVRDLNPQESIPTLKQLLECDSAEMRKAAAEALEKIEGKSNSAAKK